MRVGFRVRVEVGVGARSWGRGRIQPVGCPLGFTEDEPRKLFPELPWPKDVILDDVGEEEEEGDEACVA